MREEPDGSWGAEEDGKFTALLGQLQREEIDFAMPFGLTPGRTRVVEYCRIHPPNGLGFVTLKPGRLPQSLLLVRPYTGKLLS